MEEKRKIPEWKLNTVKELKDLISKSKTVLIASIKNLPGSQFQEIKKKLRGKAIVKVPKKNLILRAIENSSEDAKKLKTGINEDIAILFSNLELFDLALELIKNKSPAKAKPGQIAPEDIKIEAGPTELTPGPAISELGAVGIQIQIKEGKIEIKQPKVIVKAGEVISQKAAEIMNKLNIKPFSIGFVPLIGLDTQEKKIYSEIKINQEEALAKLKSAYEKALPFAIQKGYISSDTIRHLLVKAEKHAKSLGKFQKTQTPEVNLDGGNK